MATKNPAERILAFDVYYGESFVRREEINAESVTLGKGPAAMLRVEDPTVSDLHAVINMDDDGTVQLLDLGSQTGTLVNGTRVTNVSLSSGDTIQAGTVRIVVSISAEAVEERTDHGAAVPSAQASAAAPVENGPARIVSSGSTVEDVMSFVMGSGAISSGPQDPSRPQVLEVAEIWGDLVVDVKHVPTNGKSITLGSTTGYRWRILGQAIAWVPAAFANIAWAFPPTLSEATEEWKSDFYVPPMVTPHEEYKLFEWNGTQFVCNISDKWAGFVDIGEERHTFQELISGGKARAAGQGFYQIPLGADTRIIADIGPMQFFGQMTTGGKRAITKMSERLDYPFLGVMSFVVFLGLLSSILIATMPPPPENEVMEIPDRFVEMLLKEPEELPEKKPDQNPDAGEGAKAKKEEGKVGKKDAKMEKAKGNKVEMNKQQVDKEIAENAGVLGAMRDGSELDSMLGASGLSADITGGIGGLIGARGVQFGSGGLGSRGSGLGGGGTADGLGGLGTKGRGSGAGGYGAGGGSFGQKGEGAIGQIGGEPIILGALDKSLVDAVVRRNLNQIRYCYQRELTKNPSLAGKIVVKFVIAKDGTVSSASTKSSTLSNPAVENCINGRFMRFQFPSPKGGGIVFVTYPFIFAPG